MTIPLERFPMFSGAMTAMITPFRDGKLDEARLREQIEYQIKGGIDGLVPVGTTGESPTLDFRGARARHRAHRRGSARARAGHRRHRRQRDHRGAGTARASPRRPAPPRCLSVNPYYNKPTQEGLYRHFMTLADKVDLPIVLYNIPGRTGITMTPADGRAAAASTRTSWRSRRPPASLDMASEIRSLCDITILSGDDSLTLPLMSIGGEGVISVASNLLPAQIKTMVKLALAGNFAEAAGDPPPAVPA